MKFFLLIIVFLVSGCSNSHKLNITNIQTITYNDINLIESDFEKILKEVDRLEFKDLKINKSFENQLKIVSNNDIYNFKIQNDIIFYEENSKTYIAKNISNLNNILDKIENEYTDLSFFKVTYGLCNITNNDYVIKINNTNNCLTLNTNQILYNFKINSLILIEDYLTENNMLFQKDEIRYNNIVIKINLTNNFDHKISFDTKYNYSISVQPIYDNEKKDVELNILNIQKK